MAASDYVTIPSVLFPSGSFDGRLAAIYFEYRSDHLSGNAGGVLDALAVQLDALPARGTAFLMLVGFTDYKGDVDRNVDLATRRAKRVRDVLTKKMAQRGRVAHLEVDVAMGEALAQQGATEGAVRATDRRVDVYAWDEKKPRSPQPKLHIVQRKTVHKVAKVVERQFSGDEGATDMIQEIKGAGKSESNSAVRADALANMVKWLAGKAVSSDSHYDHFTADWGDEIEQATKTELMDQTARIGHVVIECKREQVTNFPAQIIFHSAKVRYRWRVFANGIVPPLVTVYFDIDNMGLFHSVTEHYWRSYVEANRIFSPGPA